MFLWELMKLGYICMCAKLLQSCLTLCALINCSSSGSSVHGDFPSKNTRVNCHALLQGIFPIQGLNSHLLYLLHWQVDSLSLVSLGKLVYVSNVEQLHRMDLINVSSLKISSFIWGLIFILSNIINITHKE